MLKHIMLKIKINSYGVLALLIVLVYCLVAANRDINVGTDTATYVDIYNMISSNENLMREIDVGFYWLVYSLSQFGGVKLLFFTVPLLIILLSSNFTVNQLSSKFAVVTFCLMLSPFFHGHTLNILRQGLAFSIILYMLQSKSSNNKYTIYMIFIAGLFHSTGFIFGFMAYLTRFMSLKTISGIWFACSIIGMSLSMDSGPLNLISAVLSSDYLLGYFSPNDSDYSSGLRLDFLIFSFAFICIGIYLVRSNSDRSNPLMDIEMLVRVIKSYILMNAFGMIFMQMPYADRWLNWSWSLIPFFLIGAIDNVSSKIIKLIFKCFLPILAIFMSLLQFGLMSAA